MTETEKTVLELIKGAVNGFDIDPDADGAKIFKEVGIDSLDKMMLLLAVQEHWDCEFTPSQVEGINSFKDVCAQVDSLPG